jgi:hypothetical protein
MLHARISNKADLPGLDDAPPRAWSTGFCRNMRANNSRQMRMDLIPSVTYLSVAELDQEAEGNCPQTLGAGTGARCPAQNPVEVLTHLERRRDPADCMTGR